MKGLTSHLQAISYGNMLMYSIVSSYLLLSAYFNVQCLQVDCFFWTDISSKLCHLIRKSLINVITWSPLLWSHELLLSLLSWQPLGDDLKEICQTKKHVMNSMLSQFLNPSSSRK